MPCWSDSRSLREAISGHNNNYTLIRAILAAGVIYSHSFGMSLDKQYVDHIDNWLVPVTSVGDLAVQCFFFLSGLFVTQSYFNDPNTLRFVFRRFFRIWPGLFVCLVVTILLACAISKPKDFGHFLLFNDVYDYILRNAVFDLTWNVPGVFDGHALKAINGPIHTLPMEAKMYVILAIVGAVGFLATPLRIGLTGAAFTLFCLMIGNDTPSLTWLFSAPYTRPAAAMFSAGVLAFATSRWIFPRLWQVAALALATSFCTGAAYSVMLFATVAWTLLYLGQSRALAKLGKPRQDLSYGIYIYGWPCQQIVLATTSTHINPYLLMTSALALSCVFAAFSWRFVEKPAITLGHVLPAAIINWLKRARPILSFAERRAARLGGVLVAVLAVCMSMRSVTTTHDFVAVAAMPVRIIEFGPREAKKGVPFNAQLDGSSAIWLKLEGAPPEGTAVYLSGHKLETAIAPGLATAKVPPSLIATAGEKKLYLERRSVNLIDRSRSVDLRVDD